MKASELIEKLKEMIEKHGDLECGYDYDGMDQIVDWVEFAPKQNRPEVNQQAENKEDIFRLT